MLYETLRLARQVEADPRAYPYEIRAHARQVVEVHAKRAALLSFLAARREALSVHRHAYQCATGAYYRRTRTAVVVLEGSLTPEEARRIAGSRALLREYRAYGSTFGSRLKALFQVLHFPDLTLLHRYLECALSKTTDLSVTPASFLHGLEGAWAAETLCLRLLEAQVP